MGEWKWVCNPYFIYSEFATIRNQSGLNSFKISKNNGILVKDTKIKTLKENGIDYICITDIAKQKNPIEPKDVVKNWLRSKNTLEYP